MKKIIVFDVPAENGGALTILNQFHDDALKDTSNHYIFVTSVPNIPESKNVTNIRFPWIKKSWVHRLYFDSFLASKLVKEQNADEVLSLQNIIIKNVAIPQTLYVHQPLPFVNKRFKITENFKFWLYQNPLKQKIFQSIKSADKVIVQTEWFKREVVNRTKVRENKVIVQPPRIKIEVSKPYIKTNASLSLFFYPASGVSYKNHEVVVNAVKTLKTKGIDNFKVVFTLDGNESKKISELYADVSKHELPISFEGSLTYDEVLNYYSKSILLFPSYIETFGLPLLEAREHGGPIIASDLPFSREILDGYDSSFLINPETPKEWADTMMLFLKKRK